MSSKLESKYEDIKKQHKKALCRTAAEVVLGSSVIRVFNQGTKVALLPILKEIDFDHLIEIKNPEEFKKWFEEELDKIAREVKKKNENNDRIQPGYKWGHTAKILNLMIREIVLNSRYFNDVEVKRIKYYLYAPIDSKIITFLKNSDVKLDFQYIKQIDTSEKFYSVQEELGKAADKIKVPRVFIDDIWSERPLKNK